MSRSRLTNVRGKFVDWERIGRWNCFWWFDRVISECAATVKSLVCEMAIMCASSCRVVARFALFKAVEGSGTRLKTICCVLLVIFRNICWPDSLQDCMQFNTLRCVALSESATDRSWREKTWNILTSMKNFNPHRDLLVQFHSTPVQHLNMFIHYLFHRRATIWHRYHSNRISSRNSRNRLWPSRITTHIHDYFIISRSGAARGLGRQPGGAESESDTGK